LIGWIPYLSPKGFKKYSHQHNTWVHHDGHGPCNDLEDKRESPWMSSRWSMNTWLPYAFYPILDIF
jgi:hypothetical protein